MKYRYLKIVILFLCFLSLPKQVHGVVVFAEDPPSANFGSISLTGADQEIDGGQGRISVKGLNLIWESMKITVQGGPLTQVGGSGLTLPSDSLQLNKPILGTRAFYTDYEDEIIGGPWFIDRQDQEPILIVSGAFTPLGVLGWANFTFEPSPFTLFIQPHVKMIDPGQTSATYTTTITWTLTSTGL